LLHSNHLSRKTTGNMDILDPRLATIAQHRGAHVHQYAGGDTFPLKDWFPFKLPEPGIDLPEAVWELALLASQQSFDRSLKTEPAPQDIVNLAEIRLQARRDNDWQTADALRDQIAMEGWKVNDTKDGYILERL